MELSNTSSKLVLNHRCYEEVSQENTIIHVLVLFCETLVKSNWYYLKMELSNTSSELVLSNRYQ